MIKRILILLFPLTLLFLNGFTQNTVVFEQTKTENYKIIGHRHPDENQINGNYIIQEIALGNSKKASQISFKLVFIQNAKIFKSGANKFIARVEIKNMVCRGDVFYKGFDIFDVLIPSELDFCINIYNQDYKLFKTGDFDNVKLNSDYSVIAEYEFDDYITNDRMFLTVDDKKIYYDYDDKERFHKRLSYINTYYSSEVIFDSVQNLIRKIKKNNLPDYFVKFSEVKRVYKYFENKNFEENLKLKYYDPAGYINNIHSLSLQITRLQTIFNQRIAENNHFYSLSMINTIVREYIDLLSTFLDCSLNNGNHSHNNAIDQLSYIKYRNADIIYAAGIIKKLIPGKFQNINFNYLILNISKSVFKNFIKKADSFIKHEKYNEALIVLQNAESFLQKTPLISQPHLIAKDISRAKFGIYYSYLKVAGKAIDAGNLSLAEGYILKAKVFQAENSSYIITDIFIDKIYGNLIDAYTYKGIEFNDSTDYNIALKYLNKALELCNSDARVQCTGKLIKALYEAKNGFYSELLDRANRFLNLGDIITARKLIEKANKFRAENSIYFKNGFTSEINDKVNFPQYMSLREEGCQLLNQKKYKEALNKFEAVKTNKREIKCEEEELDSLIKHTAKLLIFKDLADATINVIENNLTDAKLIYDEIVGYQVKYGFEKNKKINNSLQKLDDDIFEMECRNFNNEFELCILKGIQSVNNLNYIKAEEFFDAAAEVSELNPNCNIADSVAYIANIKYFPAVTYQKVLLEINKNLYDKGFKDVIEKYFILEKYYFDFQIRSFGIEHISLLEFVNSQNNSLLTIYCFDYFVEINKYERALNFLDILYEQGYPSKKIKNQQKILGEELANKNFKIDSSIDPEMKIVEYTFGYGWYKFFRKSYLKTWKRCLSVETSQ